MEGTEKTKAYPNGLHNALAGRHPTWNTAAIMLLCRIHQGSGQGDMKFVESLMGKSCGMCYHELGAHTMESDGFSRRFICI